MESLILTLQTEKNSYCKCPIYFEYCSSSICFVFVWSTYHCQKVFFVIFDITFISKYEVVLVGSTIHKYMFSLLTNKENCTKTKIEQEQRLDAVRDCPNYNQAAPLLPGTYYNGQILLFSKCRYRCCILLCNNRNIHSAEFIVICTRK